MRVTIGSSDDDDDGQRSVPAFHQVTPDPAPSGAPVRAALSAAVRTSSSGRFHEPPQAPLGALTAITSGAITSAMSGAIRSSNLAQDSAARFLRSIVSASRRLHASLRRAASLSAADDPNGATAAPGPDDDDDADVEDSDDDGDDSPPPPTLTRTLPAMILRPPRSRPPRRSAQTLRPTRPLVTVLAARP